MNDDDQVTVDFTAHDTEIIPYDSDLETVQETALPASDDDVPTTIGNEQLESVSGGMKWEDFRRSTNVEDRRTPAGKRRDEAWWERSHQPPTVPLPPRRPEGL